MKKEEWTWGPYFHWSEFDDPKSMEPDSGLNMDPKFMDKLFSLRESIGTPIAVHGAARGGYASGGHAVGSAHYLGLAADIHIPGIEINQQSNIIRDIGFDGVGFYEHWKPMPGFHVDMANRRARWIRTSDGLYVSLS
jgi:uncharacterized protein YcbK (DUF882 family)